MTPEQALAMQKAEPAPDRHSAPAHSPNHPLSLHVRKEVSSNPAGLTAREIDVLRLVAQGMTDAQVAEELVVSPRTVNWHLTAIYSKLQVSSRSGATRHALEQRLV